jgi:hypothetical protein
MIRDILVCVNAFSASENTIKVASQFASNHNARLTGLYIMNDLVNRYYAYENLSADFMKMVMDEELDRAESAKNKFSEITTEYGCTTDWHSVWESQDPTCFMLYTDLIFMGHGTTEANGLFAGTSFANTVLLETGRPIMMIPSEYSGETIGENALLAWNESRESVRVMHESLSLMQQAKKIDVVTVNGKGESDGQLATDIAITVYLTHRDINSKLFAKETDAVTPTVGGVLLKHAEDNNIDLILMGGYGHSRLREVLLGGVTRDLINQSKVPLFLLH